MSVNILDLKPGFSPSSSWGGSSGRGGPDCSPFLPISHLADPFLPVQPQQSESCGQEERRGRHRKVLAQLGILNWLPALCWALWQQPQGLRASSLLAWWPCWHVIPVTTVFFSCTTSCLPSSITHTDSAVFPLQPHCLCCLSGPRTAPLLSLYSTWTTSLACYGLNYCVPRKMHIWKP